MRCEMPVYLLTLVLIAVLHSACVAADAPPREELGRSVKLTILVDKVMQPTRKWTTEEWMIKEAADAGFNVFSPRRGNDNLDEVRDVTEWCEKYGIYHMPWMRGSLSVPKGAKADGKSDSAAPAAAPAPAPSSGGGSDAGS